MSSKGEPEPDVEKESPVEDAGRAASTTSSVPGNNNPQQRRDYRRESTGYNRNRNSYGNSRTNSTDNPSWSSSPGTLSRNISGSGDDLQGNVNKGESPGGRSMYSQGNITPISPAITTSPQSGSKMGDSRGSRPPQGGYGRQSPQQMMGPPGSMPGPGMMMMQGPPPMDPEGGRMMYPMQQHGQMMMYPIPPGPPMNQPYYPPPVPGQHMVFQPQGYPMQPPMVQIIGPPGQGPSPAGIASPQQSTGPRSVPYQPQQQMYHMQQPPQMAPNGRGGFIPMQMMPGQPMMQQPPVMMMPAGPMGGLQTPHAAGRNVPHTPHSGGAPRQPTNVSTPQSQAQAQSQSQTPQSQSSGQSSSPTGPASGPPAGSPAGPPLAPPIGQQSPGTPQTPQGMVYRYAQTPPNQQISPQTHMYAQPLGMMPPHMQGMPPTGPRPMQMGPNRGFTQPLPQGVPPMMQSPLSGPQTPTSSVSSEPYVPVRAKSKFTVKDKDGNIVDLDEMRRNRDTQRAQITSSTGSATGSGSDAAETASESTPGVPPTTDITDSAPESSNIESVKNDPDDSAAVSIESEVGISGPMSDHVESAASEDVSASVAISAKPSNEQQNAEEVALSATSADSIEQLTQSLESLDIATSIVKDLVNTSSIEASSHVETSVIEPTVESVAAPVEPQVASGAIEAIAESPKEEEEEWESSAGASLNIQRNTPSTDTTQSTGQSTSQPVVNNNDKKGKVSLKKLLASADARDNSLSILDAYTIQESGPTADSTASSSIPEPQLSPEKTSTSGAAGGVETFPSTDDADPDQDEWAKSVDKLDLKPALRRLTPGGGKNQARLNSGPIGGQAKTKYTYSKDDIHKLKSSTPQEKPTAMQMYQNVVVIDEKTNASRMVPIKGYLQFEFKSERGYREAGSSSKDSGRDPRGGGMERSSSSKTFERSSSDRSVSVLNQPVEDWKHQASHGQHNTGHGQHGGYTPGHQGGGQRRSRAPIPRPPKVITDPTLQLTTEVMQILNKITPQTFEKLTSKLCEIPVPTNALLDKLIELVFEKAIQEQYFANLYADMCAALEDQSRYWSFMQIVYNRDEQQFFWTLDLEFESELAGPFVSVEQCVDIAQSAEVALEFQTVNFKVQVVDLVVASDMLIKVFQRIQAPEEFYFSFIPCADLKPELVSETTFPTLEAAQKDALKKNSFRRRLVFICQREFECSTSNTGIYSALTEYAEWKKTTAKRLTADERAQQEAEWEEKKSKLKKRMLGNIRFVGELYKKGMISTKIMHKCIEHLIGKHENGEWVGWKDDPDEQDLEILCKFLPTVGATLDAKASSEGGENVLDWYMGRLKELSKEKSINSRIRFGLEEVMKLRENNWQSRRAQDGPKTIEQIHQKIAEEEQQKQLQQQQLLLQQQGKMSRQNSHNMSRQSSVDSSYSSRPTPRDGGDARDHRNSRDGRDNRYPPVGEQGRHQDNRFQNVRILGQEGARGERPPHGQQGQQNRRASSGSSGKGTQSGLPPTQGSNQRPSSLQASRNPSSDSFTQYGSGAPAEDLVDSRQNSLGAGLGVASAFPQPSGTELRKRVKGLISEYVRLEDVNEAHDTLVELGLISHGFFIQEILSTYVDCGPKDPKAAKLFNLIPALEAILVPARPVIEVSLGEFEMLQVLQDYLCDSPDAPVKMGKMIGQLVKMGACSLEAISGVIAGFCNEDKAADHGVSLEELTETYDALLVAVKSQS